MIFGGSVATLLYPFFRVGLFNMRAFLPVLETGAFVLSAYVHLVGSLLVADVGVGADGGARMDVEFFLSSPSIY